LQLVQYLVLKSAPAFVEALITFSGALAVLRRHSRAAAAVLLAVSCADALVTLAVILGAPLGGSNVILAGLMVWVAVRAVQATWALERMPDEDEEEEELPLRARR
jgi:hypothetical protein